MNWFKNFWLKSGDRIAYGFLALIITFSSPLWWDVLPAEMKAIPIGIATLFFNKMRGNTDSVPTPEQLTNPQNN